jgi:hypothetical protein
MRPNRLGILTVAIFPNDAVNGHTASGDVKSGLPALNARVMDASYFKFIPLVPNTGGLGMVPRIAVRLAVLHSRSCPSIRPPVYWRVQHGFGAILYSKKPSEGSLERPTVPSGTSLAAETDAT